MSEDLIFIITRCVRKEEHNRLFKECYKCIRNHYDNPIYIIDDNSDQKVLEDYPMSGVEIIQSEFPGAGEILPYYYMYHRKLGKKAIILQDSMFIQRKLEISDVKDYKFLWYFNSHNSIWEVAEKLRAVIMSIETWSQTLYEGIYDTMMEYEWHGCFGSCMIITLDFLHELQEKTRIFDLLGEIKARSDRCMLERLLGIYTHYIINKDGKDISLLGNISRHCYAWGLTYDKYVSDYAVLMKEHAIIKVWNGR